MKSLIQSLFTFILLISFINSSQAQVNALKTGLNGTKGIYLTYERAWNPMFSTSVSYFKNNYKYKDADRYTNQAKGIGLEARVYFNKGEKSLNGIYIAPNFSIKQNKLDYFNNPNPSWSTGIVTGLIGSAISGSSDPLIDSFSHEEEMPSVKGQQTLMSTSLGLKFGYQKSFGRFNYDIGFNMQHNIIGYKNKGLEVSNGSTVDYGKDINGSTPYIYVGFGYTF